MKHPRMLPFALFVLLLSASLFADVPRTMNYQGKLTDTDGIALDGSHNLTFRIYDVSFGGSMLWSEDHPTTTVTKGLFDVILGETTPIDLSFDSQYWIEILVEGEVLSPRIPLTSVGYAFRAAIADSAVGGGGGGGGVTSLNSLTGDLTLVGEGGIDISIGGSNIIANLTLESGDCPLEIDLTGGGTTNQYVPANLQTFTQSIGQFLMLQSDMGCTGGRIYRIILYSDATSGTVNDVDVWLDNVIIDNLSAGSILPSGSPAVSNTTLDIAVDNTVTIDLPHGFLYEGHNILITMRKNSTAGILSNWKGTATATVNARYNEASASFPLTSTANFRPDIKFSFLPPEMPDVVTNVNGITDTVRIVSGTDIAVATAGDSVTISYTGSGGSGSVTSVGQSTGILCAPNPITTTGTVEFDQAWGDGIYVNEGQANSITTGMIVDGSVAEADLSIVNSPLSNYVLAWNGSSMEWQVDETAAGGGVTQINQSTGITCSPNPITATGFISVNFAGSGSASTAARSDHNHSGVYDYYDYWQLQANGGSTTSISSGEIVNFASGTDISVSRSSNTITISSTGGGGVTGSGTADYLARWTSSSSIGTGATRDNGSRVGIGTAPGSFGVLTTSGTGGGVAGLFATSSSWDGVTAYGSTSGIYCDASAGHAVNAHGDERGIYCTGSDFGIFGNGNGDSGGYFSSSGGNYARVCYGSGNYKIVGTGSVSEIIPTKEHGRITLTCPESPEYWYQDFGADVLKDGSCRVELDQILRHVSFVDDDNPMKIFITPGGKLGEWWVEKNESGFTLFAPDAEDNVRFDYMIVVKPKTNYGMGRFPQAPGPADAPNVEAARTANQPNMDEIFRWQPDYEVYGYKPFKEARRIRPPLEN